MLRFSAFVLLGSLLIFLSCCHSDEADARAAEQEAVSEVKEPHPLTEQDILGLPERMTVDELFKELWPVDLVDPPIFFYPSVVDDHAYMACPHPDDGEALARGDYANVRIRSIFHFRFVGPTKIYEPALWGKSPFVAPYLPASDPFDPAPEE